MIEGHHRVGDVRAGDYIQIVVDGPWRRVHKVISLPSVRAVDIRFRGGGRVVLPAETTVQIRVWTGSGMQLVPHRRTAVSAC